MRRLRVLRVRARPVLNAICNTFVGYTDSTDMKDTSFQRGFWEAPETRLGIICEALVCPAVLLGASWSSPGVSWGSPRGPWDVFGERPGCVFVYRVEIAGIFVQTSLRTLAKSSCLQYPFVHGVLAVSKRNRASRSMQVQVRSTFGAGGFLPTPRKCCK